MDELMTDITEQLQECLDTAALAQVTGKFPVRQEVLSEAMTEIEKLRAENRELRFRVLNPNAVINDVTNEPTWRSSD